MYTMNMIKQLLRHFATKEPEPQWGGILRELARRKKVATVGFTIATHNEGGRIAGVGQVRGRRWQIHYTTKADHFGDGLDITPET
jgi:hypothetical protein